MKFPIRNMKKRTNGFSLLEMLITVAIFTVVGGLALDGVTLYQQRYKAEETKLDMVQESREFLDQLTRDLHQSGYPTRQMFQCGDASCTGVSTSQMTGDSRVAQGLASFSDYDLQFYGDTDGDGTINLIEYTLFDVNGNQYKGGAGNCPCTLRRSQISKNDPTPHFTTELENVINSNGRLSLTPSTDDAAYATYKAAPVFQGYDASGVPTVNVGQVRSVNITVNVLSPKPDPKTGVKPVMSLEATGYIGNVQQ
jgi:prepilin-type N-terminal cleavage/methylation domain-containing protein